LCEGVPGFIDSNAHISFGRGGGGDDEHDNSQQPKKLITHSILLTASVPLFGNAPAARRTAQATNLQSVFGCRTSRGVPLREDTTS
jgi:hypothetical protein